jgi:hypothetical protein
MNDAQVLDVVGTLMFAGASGVAVAWFAQALVRGNTVKCARCHRYCDVDQLVDDSIVPLCVACDRALDTKGAA